MAEIEIGPLADRLADDELAELLKKLEKVGAPAMSAEDDGEATTIAVGTARPIAHGQATTRTAIAKRAATSRLS